jgi:tRNA 2-thiouridine synthesizing protein A
MAAFAVRVRSATSLEMTPNTQILDTSGYRCPIPVIRLEAALREMVDGAQVTVIADDPVAAVDIPHFCREAGHTVTRLEAAEGVCVFLVTRAAKST